MGENIKKGHSALSLNLYLNTRVGYASERMVVSLGKLNVVLSAFTRSLPKILLSMTTKSEYEKNDQMLLTVRGERES